MSSYSKKYTNLKDDQKHLFLTWETGYKNVKVYYEGQLIQTIDSPGKFRKGVEFDHPDLNKVELMFSTGSPIILQVKANGLKYYPDNISTDSLKNDLTGLVYIFSFLSFFAIIGAVFTQVNYGMALQTPILIITLIFDIIIVAIYAVSAIFIHKQKRWAYFMGSITFLLITLVFVLNITLIQFSFVAFFFLILRIVIIFFILTHFKTVMKLSKKVDVENQDLLDNYDF